MLDPASEPVPKSNGISFVLYRYLLFALLISPQERCQTPAAEATVARDEQKAVGPHGSPCGERTEVSIQLLLADKSGSTVKEAEEDENTARFKFCLESPLIV